MTRVAGDVCHLLTPDGLRHALVPGRLRRDTIVVGDWVLIAPDGVIDAVLERRTRLQRAAAGRRAQAQIIAANVDRVFIVMGLDRDYNLRRLERYLALCADAGVETVVFLTKAGDGTPKRAEVEALTARAREVAGPAGAVAVEAIDVIEGVAADVPARHVASGMTIALLGSSGAGKSTLVNHLLGERGRQRTAPVSETDARGTHTTVSRELFLLPGGGLLIDNPGMRELGLWLDGEGLSRAFSDLTELAAACRFTDCSHQGEPGCALRAAVARGELDGARLDSYHRLQHEGEVMDRRRDRARQRDHERQRTKLYRSVKKAKRPRD
ncbi:MAG: ribosome small subunit-dependent GTPase A [Myxococcales bacterium]|nr:ribosome small subunit-dependent GTPase A [Myxococcales bacterium]